MAHTANMTGSAQAKRYTTLWYGNTAGLADIDPAKGFGGFWFEVDEGDGNAVKKDQDGAGFALPTDKIMLAEGTCEKTINVAVSESQSDERNGGTEACFTGPRECQAKPRVHRGRRIHERQPSASTRKRV